MTWKTLIEEMKLQDIPFSNETLSHLNTVQIEVGETRVGSVDLSRVVGTTHTDYCGKNWGELKPVKGTLKGDFINDYEVAYQSLKRAIGNIQSLERNPEYYFRKEEKDHWSFYQIENDYYVSSGNNRTVIGRLFFHLNEQPPIVYGVKITKAVFKSEPEITLERKGFIPWVVKWLRA